MANKDTTIVTHLTFIENIYGFLQLGRNFVMDRKACSTRQNILWFGIMHILLLTYKVPMRAMQNVPLKASFLLWLSNICTC